MVASSTLDLKQQPGHSTKGELLALLLEANCIKRGQFTLKSGDLTDIYVNLREATMNQKLFHSLKLALVRVLKENLHLHQSAQELEPAAAATVAQNPSNVREPSLAPASPSVVARDEPAEKAERIAIVGVPYGVVPIASVVADSCQLLYYPVRKEIKSYGYKELDETLYKEHRFILLEDVMSSGSSIIETIEKMGGKNITDVVVIVDRESGGEQNLKARFPSIRLHSILKLSEIKRHLYSN